MNRLIVSIWITFGLVFTQASYADWTKIPSNAFQIPLPPDRGSKAEIADFKALHTLEMNRSEKVCAFARSQAIPGVASFYGSRTGTLSRENYQVLYPMLVRVFKFTDRVTSYFKRKYDRNRPVVTDPTLRPCVETPSGATSYPSSHSSMGYVSACILKEVFPAISKNITEYGKWIGQTRAIVGVHHPSDVVAGWILGEAICSTLLRTPEFQAELKYYKSLVRP